VCISKPRQDLIQENYQLILDRINGAARSVGRDPQSIRVVVVTKKQPIDVVQAAIAAGAQYLGENYVEEAVQKIRALTGSADTEWHMIGHVQSRKAALIPQYFKLLHSLDSLKLAGRINHYAEELKIRLPVLLQMNVSGEESKSGWNAWREESWVDLLTDIQEVLSLSNIKIQGLMTMPPLFIDPELARPYFVRLRHLQEFLIRAFPQTDWHELSMGMSGDFEVAIQEGATWVRIGQAILGPRPE
jgi:pyridoxal phosphate enzyme (YggS family)